MLATTIVPTDIVEESVLGKIRQAEYFIYFLRRFIQFLHERKTSGPKTKVTSPACFLHEIRQDFMEAFRSLRFYFERQKLLLH